VWILHLILWELTKIVLIFILLLIFWLMFFIDRLDLDRRFRILRKEIESRGINEELRGWSFENPPVQPPGGSKYLGVSELAARYCETLRDIYLRRILRVPPPPTIKLARGLIIHSVCHRSLYEVKKSLLSRFTDVTGYEIINELLPKMEEIISGYVNEAVSIFCKSSVI